MSHGERAAQRSNKRRELDSKRCKKVKCAPTSKFAKKLTHQVERRKTRAETRLEVHDRYSALGVAPPDVSRICKGQCEGLGMYPKHGHKKLVKCERCNGTGLEPEQRKPEPARRMMECDDCGNQQEDMGKGVVCEACDGPLHPLDES